MNEVELTRDVTALIAAVEPLLVGKDLRVVAATIGALCRRAPGLEAYVVFILESHAREDAAAKPTYLGFAAKPTFVGKS